MPKNDFKSEDGIEFYHPQYDSDNYDFVHNSFDVGQTDLIVDGCSIVKPGLRTNLPTYPCRLCNLTNKEVSKTYYLSPDFIIIDCPVCDVPVVISRLHSSNISLSIIAKIQRITAEIFPAMASLYKKSDVDHLNWHVIRNEADLEEVESQHGIQGTV